MREPVMKWVSSGVVSLVLLLGCGSDDEECTLEAQVAERRASSSRDCGNIALDAPQDAFLAARQCALDAASAKQPFHVIARSSGIDSLLGTAFVFRGADSRIELFSYDSQTGSIAASGCTQLTLEANDANCVNDRRNGLCLVCAGRWEIGRVCRGSAAD